MKRIKEKGKKKKLNFGSKIWKFCIWMHFTNLPSLKCPPMYIPIIGQCHILFKNCPSNWLKKSSHGLLLWWSRLRIQCCQGSSVGDYSGVALIPGVGISISHGCGQKKSSHCFNLHFFDYPWNQTFVHVHWAYSLIFLHSVI